MLYIPNQKTSVNLTQHVHNSYNEMLMCEMFLKENKDLNRYCVCKLTQHNTYNNFPKTGTNIITPIKFPTRTFTDTQNAIVSKMYIKKSKRTVTT